MDFDNLAVGAAQAQYLIDRAGATTGNNLYLYAGNAADDNSFLFLEGAWEKLQPRIADGTFVIRNSSVAAALAGQPHPQPRPAGRIIAQVTTNWDAGTARTLAAGNLAAVRRPTRAPSSSWPPTTPPPARSRTRSRPTGDVTRPVRDRPGRGQGVGPGHHRRQRRG